MKKPISKNTAKNKKKPAAFRVMQDRFIDDVDFHNELSKNDLSSGVSRNQRQLEGANSTANVRDGGKLFAKARNAG